MKVVFPKYYERLLVGVGLLAVAGSVGWFCHKQEDIRRIRAMPVSMLETNSAYEATEPAGEIQPPHPLWQSPMPQSSGEAWRYELFTPPAVFFHRESASFIVMSPQAVARSDAPFGLELLAVRRELFRVQLAGYFGEPGSYAVIFTQPGKSGSLHGAVGARFEDLGLRIKNISVRRVAVKHPDDWPVYEVVASAGIFDEHSESVVVLDNRHPAFADAAVATVKFLSTDDLHHDVREGDVLSNEGSQYRIERIMVEPAGITVSRERGGLRTETLTLHPVDAGSDRKIAVTTNLAHPNFTRSATGIAHNDK